MDRIEDWDVYDAHRSLVGRLHQRGREMEPGDFHLVVQVWICNNHGEYLIQKRSMEKELAPGLWATTAGSATAGEDSLTTCLRETEEEIGLALDPDLLEPVLSYTRTDSHVDVWWVRMEADLSRLALQEEEVDAVRWATPAEIRTMADAGEFWGYRYLDRLEEWAGQVHS